MTTYLLYFSVFAAAVLLTGLLGSLLSNRATRQRSLNRRMQVLDASGDRLRGLANIRLERGLSADGTLGEAFSTWRRLYTQSGVVTGIRRLLAYSAVFATALGLLISSFTNQHLLGVAAAIIVFMVAPYLYLSFRRKQRLDRFARQLPDSIDIIVRSLHAGHPLSTSLTLVAEEMPDPIGSEFGMMNDELTYGTDMETALQNLSVRVPVEDISMFAMAIVIQRQTGGNLAEILETLSVTIRDRYMLKQKIRSITAEGRFSAVFMTLFPFLIFLVIRLLSPRYFDPLWDSGYGPNVVIGCVVAMAIGNMVMRRMVNFRF